jgi:hypothetical protein
LRWRRIREVSRKSDSAEMILLGSNFRFHNRTLGGAFFSRCRCVGKVAPFFARQAMPDALPLQVGSSVQRKI